MSEQATPSTSSRRDLLTQTIPALAIGTTLLGAANVLAQDNAAAGIADGKGPGAILKLLGASQKDGQYTLPPLPYPPDALEPHIDAQTMTLHHTKHHQAYVDNLNKAVASLAKAREEPELDTAKLASLTRDISFNAGGHILHTLFWGTLKPTNQMDVQMVRPVQGDIEKQYGSLEKFQNHFSKVAAGVKGSGWAVAYYEALADKILVAEVGDQDNRLIPTATPILLLDVWEHAYYLKYQNKRADYIKAWWNVVNWAEVDSFYGSLRKMYGR